MLNEYHGLGLQLGWEILPHLSWFNHLDMAYRKGYYGRKSPYTIVHTNHHSHIYDYQTRLTFEPSISRYIILTLVSQARTLSTR